MPSDRYYDDLLSLDPSDFRSLIASLDESTFRLLMTGCRGSALLRKYTCDVIVADRKEPAFP